MSLKHYINYCRYRDGNLNNTQNRPLCTSIMVVFLSLQVVFWINALNLCLKVKYLVFNFGGK